MRKALKRTMKIAHFSMWAPRRSGLYEYVKDQIKYERKAGLDSVFICCDTENPDPLRFTDEDMVAQSWESASDANVWVMHRIIPIKLYKDLEKHGSVAVLHGVIEYMLMQEIHEVGKTLKFSLHLSLMRQYDRSVAINETDYEILKQYDTKDRLVYIRDSIDLERYNPEGMKWEYAHRPAVISTANVRFNKLPVHVLWAMKKIQGKLPNARLNIYCITLSDLNVWKKIVLAGKTDFRFGCIENFQLQIDNLSPFIRGADIGFNSNINGVASRDTMEQMAMGIPVISYGGSYTAYHAKIMNLDSIAEKVCTCWDDIQRDKQTNLKKKMRLYAERNFSMKEAVKKFFEVYQQVAK